MKKIRIVLLATLAAVICLSFSACGDFKGYDDDAAIAKGSTWSTVVSSEKNVGKSYTFTANKANGVKTVGSIEIAAGSTQIDLTLSLDEGRCKIVLVKSGEPVYMVCEGNTTGPVTVTGVPAGKNYSVRIVAEAATRRKA